MYPLWQVLLTGAVCGIGGALLGVMIVCMLVSSTPDPCAVTGCPHRRA